jgi:hypothetical protein
MPVTHLPIIVQWYNHPNAMFGCHCQGAMSMDLKTSSLNTPGALTQVMKSFGKLLLHR